MSQKILIIEDEPDIRKTLEYNISREGYKVVSSSSLSEGKEQINSSDFSLILLDLMLPDGSGLDLCREIKSDKDKSSTPIIILTAKDDEVDKVVGFELGADDYVTKPFSVRELILRIKAILKRGESKKKLLRFKDNLANLPWM
jgi:DNA-binding response OmpR family regulator